MGRNVPTFYFLQANLDSICIIWQDKGEWIQKERKSLDEILQKSSLLWG